MAAALEARRPLLPAAAEAAGRGPILPQQLLMPPPLLLLPLLQCDKGRGERSAAVAAEVAASERRPCLDVIVGGSGSGCKETMDSKPRGQR